MFPLRVTLPTVPALDVNGNDAAVTGWNVYLNGDLSAAVATTDASATTVDFDVDAEGDYFVQVAAVNAQGESEVSDPSATVTAEAPVVPGVPAKPGVPTLEVL